MYCNTLSEIAYVKKKDNYSLQFINFRQKGGVIFLHHIMPILKAFYRHEYSQYSRSV